MSLLNPPELLTDAFPVKPRAAVAAESLLDSNQKKALGISAAALLLGGGAMMTCQNPPGEKPPTKHPTPVVQVPTEETPTAETPAVTPPDDIDVAGKVTADMSFAQAFAAAREEVSMGGVFSWHGHWYNTFEKEEWAALSLQQRQEYTEHVTGEKLPVIAYRQVSETETPEPAPVEADPILIEGHLNGMRVMGLDYNHDGVIDTLVLDGADGYTYRVVDAVGDDGLDTIFQYDSLSGQMTDVASLDEPVVLNNDQFRQGLEESMSQEVVESILEPTTTDPAPIEPASQINVDATVDMEQDNDDDDDSTVMMAENHEPDDTYVNDGDVQDMDE